MAPAMRPGAAAFPGWTVWPAVALAVVFDWLVARSMPVFGYVPDGVLAVGLALAAVGQRRLGAAAAFTGGLMGDVVGGVLVGLGAATRAAAVAGAAEALARLRSDSPVVAVVVAFAAAVGERLLGLVGAWAFGLHAVFSLRVFSGVVGDALLTTAVFAAAYPAFEWLSWSRARARAGIGRVR